MIVDSRSDILPVAGGSAEASLAIIMKQLHSVGMPTWDDVANVSRTFRVLIESNWLFVVSDDIFVAMTSILYTRLPCLLNKSNSASDSDIGDSR